MPRKPTEVLKAPATPRASRENLLFVAKSGRVLGAEGKRRGKIAYIASDGRKVTSDSRMVLVPQSSGCDIVIEAQQILQ